MNGQLVPGREKNGISDYAIIGDCRTAALVSREGSVDWVCFPYFSGASVFSALLDTNIGGRFAIRPVGDFTTNRRYIGATAVLETTFRTTLGSVRLTDLMPISTSDSELCPMRELLRIVEGIDGEVTLEVRWEPRPDYARTIPRITYRGALGWACIVSDELLLLHTDTPLGFDDHRAAVVGRVRIWAGEKRAFSLTYTKADIGVIAPLGEAAEQRMLACQRWWEAWSRRCAYSGPYRENVMRSAITLKLMTFVLSGAVVAAPTTSLPERIGGDLNWDYRYCWLRDAALTMRAFTDLGFGDEADAFLRWLLHATRLTWPRLRIMYDVYGRTNLKERELSHLSGFCCSRPVRVGNGAYDQRQLDVYGGVIYAAFHYVETGGKLESDESRLLAGFGNTVCQQWREPDSGIWESRGPPRHHTLSKAMCAIALDCLIKLHEAGHIKVDADRFRSERAAIRHEVRARGFNAEIASYVSELDSNRIDASLLLLGCLDYEKADSPRMRSTFDVIHASLGCGGLLYRYEDDIERNPPREGAFGICSFWAAENLARRGDREAAASALDHILSFANDVGLFAEEIDVGTGAAVGNFPQAFTHIGLINAAVALVGDNPGQALG